MDHSRKARTKINIKKRYREKRNLTKEQMSVILENDVFTDHNYIRHIEQTAHDLGIPSEAVKEVITDYLKKVSFDMLKITTFPRRFSILGWVFIDILEEKYYEINNIKSKRYYGSK